MSRAAPLTPSADHMAALLEHLARIADAQERTAGAIEEVGDRMGELAVEIRGALEHVVKAIDHIN